jgi:hypothetical protein
VARRKESAGTRTDDGLRWFSDDRRRYDHNCTDCTSAHTAPKKAAPTPGTDVERKTKGIYKSSEKGTTMEVEHYVRRGKYQAKKNDHSIVAKFNVNKRMHDDIKKQLAHRSPASTVERMST